MFRIGDLEIRDGVLESYPDVFTKACLDVLVALAPYNSERRALMDARTRRRQQRIAEGRSIGFLDPAEVIPGTTLAVSRARAGQFAGSAIPKDLERQWIQGTGPAARPAHHWNRACGMWRTRSCPALMAGCSTVKMPWDRSRPCPWTTIET